jgi:hypothetical protein
MIVNRHGLLKPVLGRHLQRPDNQLKDAHLPPIRAVFALRGSQLGTSTPFILVAPFRLAHSV